MIKQEEIGAKVQDFVTLTYGSQTKAGRELGVDSSYISGIVRGRWPPSVKILDAMGLKRVAVEDPITHNKTFIYEESDIMKERKFQQLYRDMTATSKKVYDVVPLEEEWPINKIVTELNRRGASLQFSTIEACLNQMRESGIIKRNTKMEYSREHVEVREETPPIQKEEPVALLPPITLPSSNFVPPKPLTPIDILGELAAQANVIALSIAKINEDVQKLQTDIENAAITIQEAMETETKELIELRQLRTILKQFMG